MSLDLPLIVSIFFIHWVAMMSPGPDFLLVSKNALTSSTSNGLATATGIASGIVLHLAYCILGIAVLVSQSIILFNVVKILGGVYLIYLGIKCLLSKPTTSQEITYNAQPKIHQKTLWQSFREGFVTNALNPKVTIFFLSIFTTIVAPETNMATKIAMGVIIVVSNIVWFSTEVFVLSRPLIQAKFLRYRQRIDRVFGVLLCGLGLKVMVTS